MERVGYEINENMARGLAQTKAMVAQQIRLPRNEAISMLKSSAKLEYGEEETGAPLLENEPKPKPEERLPRVWPETPYDPDPEGFEKSSN